MASSAPAPPCRPVRQRPTRRVVRSLASGKGHSRLRIVAELGRGAPNPQPPPSHRAARRRARSAVTKINEFFTRHL
jgi:hypothetical protein